MIKATLPQMTDGEGRDEVMVAGAWEDVALEPTKHLKAYHKGDSGGPVCPTICYELGRKASCIGCLHCNKNKYIF